jgi:hypothetical protein
MERRTRARMPPRLGVVLALERARAILHPLAHHALRPWPERMRARLAAARDRELGMAHPPAGDDRPLPCPPPDPDPAAPALWLLVALAGLLLLTLAGLVAHALRWA